LIVLVLKGKILFMVWCIFGIVLLIISINDFLFFRIENEAVQFLLALYAVSCILGVSGTNFLFGLAIACGVFFITWALNQYNLIGGGDVKLLFPLLLFSENNLTTFMMGVSVSGLILSFIYIVFGRYIFFFRRKIVTWLYIFYKRRKKLALLNIALLSLGRITKKAVSLKQCVINNLKQEIPYGVALSCGGFCVIVENLLSR
jgi:Flp pilus assembly protein protease CpaA